MSSSHRYVALRVSLFIFSAIGLVIYIAAFSLPAWSKHEDREEGLWQIGYKSGGQVTYSLWPAHLKTSLLKMAQVIGCLGLAFYVFFAITSALSIFWTNNWKFARSIKFSAVVFALLAATGIAVCLVIYKTDRETESSSMSTAWFLALIGAVIALIAAPCYLVDALRTIAPEKPDRKKMICNTAPVPTVEQMPPPTLPPMLSNGKWLPPKTSSFQGPDNFVHKNGGRPPMLNELRRYKTSFVHPPPNPPKKKITTKEINSLPLPPSKTKLNLLDKDDVEGHPSPAPPPILLPQNADERDGDDVSIISADSSLDISENQKECNKQDHSVFKFHKAKTIQKCGKTFLKIRQEGNQLPPIMIDMPGNDEVETEEERAKRRAILLLHAKLEEDEARKKHELYFEENKIEKRQIDKADRETPNLNKKKKKNELQSKSTKLQKEKKSQMLGAYSGVGEKKKSEKKANKKSKKKTTKRNKITSDANKANTLIHVEESMSESSDSDLDPGDDGTSDRNSTNLSRQDGLTIFSEDENNYQGRLNNSFIADADLKKEDMSNETSA